MCVRKWACRTTEFLRREFAMKVMSIITTPAAELFAAVK
jgi:hypothetical protein